ncbi:MAG: hypothetical protein M1814_000865 [Vezdaea aestivalis]|nr:MAG: hypothetical protein M1814_000865 [Vezdaea aestivalis]
MASDGLGDVAGQDALVAIRPSAPSDRLAIAIGRAEKHGDEELRRLLIELDAQHQEELSVARVELEIAKDSLAKANQAETEARQANLLKDKAAKSKSIFLANVSHELRTPLNGMVGMSELLKQTEMTPKQLEYVDSIRVCGDTLLQVINDILDFSKIEAGKLRMFNVPFSLREAVPEVIRAISCSQPLNDKVRTIEKLDLPAKMVYGDNVRLHQIFMNLLSNSYKFTQKGTVIINGRTDEEDDNSIRITCSVEDTGIGISEEQVKKLFRPFSQADDSTGHRYGGSGLGLSICKSLIEMMGGKIWIDSREGQGTTVSFNLTYPKATPNMQASVSDVSTPNSEPLTAFPQVIDFENPEPKRRREDTSVDLSKIPKDQLKICVAEDNPINQKIALGFVDKFGYQAMAFDNGRVAIDALRKSASEGSPFHIVLMDVQMPVLGGYEATAEIRRDSNPLIRDILIIAMTASAVEGDREKCIQAGMNDYLAKPVRQAALRAKLLSWLRKRTPQTPKSSSPIIPHPKSPVVPSKSSTPEIMMPPPSISVVPENPENARSQARPRPNRASTGSQIMATSPSLSPIADLMQENVQPLTASGRPRPAPRKTASGRVETLKSLSRLGG